MGLLDGLFGKDEISKLQQLLLAKNQDIVRLGSQIAELNSTRISLQSELSSQSQIADEQKEALRKSTATIQSLEIDVQRLLTDLEALRSSTSRQIQNDSDLISNLQNALEETKSYLLAANKQRDEIASDLLEKQNIYLDKDRAYLDRESKLAEKSEKLQIERQLFHQQASDLQRREHEWKHRIEPKIAQYNTHLSIDKRQHQLVEFETLLFEREKKLQLQEADLKRRDATDTALSKRQTDLQDWNSRLAQKQVELDTHANQLQREEADLLGRTSNLENWSQELSAFQKRVDQLDLEAQQIAAQRKALERKIEVQQEKHAERLSDIRQIKSEITKEKRFLSQREQDVTEREKEVKKEERTLLVAKNKNITLLNENKALRVQLEDLGDTDSERDAIQQSLDALSEQFEETKSALLHPTVLSWLVKDGDYIKADVNNGWLGVTGTGPWEQASYKNCLKELGYTFYPLSDEDHSCVIVGRNGWSAPDLRNLIDAHQGKSLRIYSQEMFVAKLATGRDPFDAQDVELLDAFAEDHPALQFLMSLPDPWPDITDTSSAEVTLVPPGSYGGVTQSPLNILDYHAGVTANQSAATRRNILEQCLGSRHLPFSDDSSADYIAQWGRSNSAQRLYRIALHLKILAEGQGKDPRKQQARLDWISDSKWLKENYFSKYKRSFSWPAI